MIVGLFKLRCVTLVLLDLSWISRVQVNQAAVLRRAEQIQARRSVKKEWQVQALLSILSPHLTMHASFLKATVLNFPQDASKLKGLQLSVAYFNNSCMMMMGWRKITHLSKQVKNLITFEWPDRKWIWSIFIHERIKWHISSTHLFSFLAMLSSAVFFFFNFKAMNIYTWCVHCWDLR